MSQKIAVLSFSGGMDSSSLLFKTLADGYDKVFCYGFDYGQRHSVELSASQNLIRELKDHGYSVDYQLINVRDVFSDSQSALGTQKAQDVPENEYNIDNLKVTVVENRNVIFSAIIYGKALALSKLYDADVTIMMGVHGNDNCFTGDTRFLTPRGMKSLNSISVGDEIFSVNSESGKIEKDKITDIIRVGQNSEIFEITTGAGTLRLTGDHKVYTLGIGYFNRESGYDKTIEIKLAKDLKEGDFLFQPTSLEIDNHTKDEKVDLLGILESIKVKHSEQFEIRESNGRIWIGRDCYQHLSIPRVVDAGDFAELIAWYITEGSSAAGGFNMENKNGSKYRAEFSQSLYANQHKVDRIVELLKRLESPIKYQFSKKIINGAPKEMVFYASNATSVFMKDCGNNAYSKDIPEWLMDILRSNSAAREQFLAAMIMADGYSKFGCEGFCSVSRNLITKMKELLWLSGYYVQEFISTKSTRYISFTKPGRKRSMMVGDVKATKITKITKSSGEPVDVFDITVEKNHNFFAGIDGAMLISNSVYPDCRPESVNMARELYKISNYGSERIDYEAPFVDLTKTQVLREGLIALDALGLEYTIYENTSSCYNPEVITEKGIVLACGKCATCLDRLKAFEENGLVDPIAYDECDEE